MQSSSFCAKFTGRAAAYTILNSIEISICKPSIPYHRSALSNFYPCSDGRDRPSHAQVMRAPKAEIKLVEWRAEHAKSIRTPPSIMRAPQSGHLSK